MKALLFLSLVSFAAACGKDEPAALEAPAPTRVVADPKAPDGTLATISLADPGPFYAGAASLFETELVRSIVAPANSGDALDRLVGVAPQVKKHVPANAPIAGLVLEAEGRLGVVYAVRLDRVAEGVAPLPGVEVRPGAPADGFWLLDPSAPNAAPMALVGDLLLVGTAREAIEQAHAHLAHLVDQKGDATLRIDFVPEALARRLRPVLEDVVRALAQDALADAARARAEKGRAPELGEPETIVTSARDETLELVALLPDLEALGATLRFEGDMARFDAVLTAKPGSPLADKLAHEASRGDVRGLLRALPEDAALAVVVSTGDRLVDALEGAAAARLGEADRARLETALGGEGARSVALGGDAEGGFLQIAREGGEGRGWAETLLSIAHVRTLLSALAACPSPKAAPKLDASGAGTLCATGAAKSSLAHREEAGRRALTLATAEAKSPRKRAPESAPLADKADAARAIAALGEPLRFAIYLESSRVLPSLAIASKRLELKALASQLSPRPLLVGGTVEGSRAEITLVLTRGAIDRTALLLGELGRVVAD